MPSAATRSAMRRLYQRRPELFARVESGELSLHGAMIAAGWRHRVAPIRTDDAVSAAATLRERMPADVLARLVELLVDRHA